MVRLAVALLLLIASPAAATQANPIRKVVTLMQNMQKEIEAQGAKEKELFDKFMCYCSGGSGDLDKAMADASAQIDELTARLKSEEAEKSGIGQQLIDHKTDREGAKNDLSEATMLRKKEQGEFEALKADSDTNIAAMAGAIPALEKGMGGAALLQLKGGNTLRMLVQSYPNMDPQDRRDATAFLEQSSESPGTDQIVGILKAMKDEMEASLKDAVADEAKSVAGFGELKASKEKEVELATEAIETKTARAGELAVSVVQTADSLEDTKVELADTEKFASQLKSQCGSKEQEWAERSKLRNEEIAAISEAISILNDDDALDVFKKAIPSAALAQIGFLQRSEGKASGAKKAQAILAGVAAKHKSASLSLMLYTLNSKLKLHSSGGFDEVVKMVDEMVVLLGKQQKEDDKQKTFCEGEFDKAHDEEAAAKTKLDQVDAALAEQSDAISTLMQEISDLTASINELDKATADATEQRKEEHAEYVETMQMNEAAMGLVEKAKNRMQKFYNPALYKAPPKKEMSQEEKIMQAGSFIQVHRDSSMADVAPPPAPETFSGPLQKNEKSSGVIGLMDNIIKDLGNDMKDAEYEEKTAQKDYAELMGDSQETRAQDSKSLTGKKGTKSEVEGALITSKENRASTSQDIKLVANVIQDLHASCDFIMQNHDLRQEARGNEVEGLKNAKAVLLGANFS